MGRQKSLKDLPELAKRKEGIPAPDLSPDKCPQVQVSVLFGKHVS